MNRIARLLAAAAVWLPAIAFAHPNDPYGRPLRIRSRSSASSLSVCGVFTQPR